MKVSNAPCIKHHAHALTPPVRQEHRCIPGARMGRLLPQLQGEPTTTRATGTDETGSRRRRPADDSRPCPVVHHAPRARARLTHMQALKKIINSLAAGRPASEAALLSRGGRPSKRRLSDALPTDTSAPFSPAPSDTATPVFAPATEPPSTDVGDLEPLPPEAEAPAPGGSRNLLSSGAGANGATDRGESFKAHRDVFFFTLQRELEKVSSLKWSGAVRVGWGGPGGVRPARCAT